jgi:predicted acetyltransferase
VTGTDAAPAFQTAPEDPTSLANLAKQGLRYTVVDTTDPTAFGAWLNAEDRGFLQPAPSPAQLERSLRGLASRRTIGVYEAQAGDSDGPVATTNAWPGELTVPGSTSEHPRTLPSWAISGVTVAPTHRRRGIARNLLEGELRTAVALGLPMAMLTVTESTIYGRFGFAPAAFAADWTVDLRRVTWSGPAPSGRVEFVSVADYRAQAPELYDRVRLTSAGEITTWPLRWDQLAGATDPESERTKSLRAVRSLDEAGVARGLALYHQSGGDEDFTQHTVTVDRLDAETPDAELALWRFLLELDLTVELKASLRRVEEPMRWRLGDFRAAKVSVWEHQYLRVLDVKTVFEARGYLNDGELALRVTDPLGFAEGAWLLSVADGAARVTTATTPPDSTPALSLTVNELSAVYLGGVSVSTLVAAGRITELNPGAALAADALLRTDRAPWLSFWY